MKLLNDTFLKRSYKPIEDVFKKINKITEELNIVFVFGSASKESIRNLFINYTKKSSSKLIYITIEDLTIDLKENVLQKGIKQELIKLIDLEYRVISLSYCVVIFPESPGSFAELGFFSKELHTKQKIFALKDYEYADDDSYVNRLIDYIHKDRNIYSSTLRFKNSDGESKKKFKKELKSTKFPKILKKIDKDYDSTKIFLPKSPQLLKRKDLHILPLALIHELILIYPYLRYSELKVVYQQCLSKNFNKIPFDKDEMNYIISLLVVSEYIKRVSIDNSYYFVNLIPNSFFEFDENIVSNYELTKQEISLTIRMEKGIENDF